MNIEIKDEDLPMLHKMVERGWADGDLAEYLNGDQIQSCERVMAALGFSPYHQAESRRVQPANPS